MFPKYFFQIHRAVLVTPSRDASVAQSRSISGMGQRFTFGHPLAPDVSAPRLHGDVFSDHLVAVYVAGYQGRTQLCNNIFFEQLGHRVRVYFPGTVQSLRFGEWVRASIW
jgi:hypothetical protein